MHRMAAYDPLIQDRSFIRLFSYFTLLLLLFLNGCSTVHRDGPPSYDVDVSKIPNAVPKVEPLSKLGNQSTYKVFGKRYYVLTSSKNYQEIGVASWYGTKFHHHRTSNGERYDMLAMTAAHKSLPLPTYVEVTNLNNHRQVIVKVNDRGPFENGRLIDLSYAAAKKLGMLGRGTAPVMVKAIDPATFNQNIIHTNNFYLATRLTPAPTTAPTIMHNEMYLQIGAFHNKVYAEQLKRKVVQTVESPVVIANHNDLYQVRIGPIKNPASISRINQQLKRLGIASRTVTI